MLPLHVTIHNRRDLYSRPALALWLMEQKNPDFHVVLDSNTVWAGGARDLVNRKASWFIRHPPKERDVKIHWYLPNIVKEERLFQMGAEAQALLGHIGKASDLLGLGLTIDADALRDAVSKVVHTSMADHKFIEKYVDPGRVDWSALMLNAVRREAPFERGDTEKGFRDAIVLEAFLQVAEEELNKDPSCKVVLISNDGLLGEAATDRIRSLDPQRVMVVENIDKLKSIINAVPAHLTMLEINNLLASAAIDFYDEKNRAGLYLSEKVEPKLLRKFSSVTALPPDVPITSRVRWKGLVVSPPIFVEKYGQQITFQSDVTVVAELEVQQQMFPISSITTTSGTHIPGTSFSTVIPSAG